MPIFSSEHSASGIKINSCVVPYDRSPSHHHEGYCSSHQIKFDTLCRSLSDEEGGAHLKASGVAFGVGTLLHCDLLRDAGPVDIFIQCPVAEAAYSAHRGAML